MHDETNESHICSILRLLVAILQGNANIVGDCRSGFFCNIYIAVLYKKIVHDIALYYIKVKAYAASCCI